MQGNMWVESELGKGSKFFFTITSQISHQSSEIVLSKMVPFAKRTILFIDTLEDKTSVVERISELGLCPFVVKSVTQVSDKERCPHIDTILVDSLTVTEQIREYEHLRYIPIVLLAPVSSPSFAFSSLTNLLSSTFTA